MAHTWDNRERVRPAGLPARGLAALIDALGTWIITFGLFELVVQALRLVHQVTDREVGLTHTATNILAVTSTCVAALVGAAWSAGRGGPGLRSMDVRIVDASTYASIGLPRALFRYAVRELVFVGILLGSLDWALDHRPESDLRAWGYGIGYVAACRIAPLALAWFLPRKRSLHDLVAHTIPISSGPLSVAPRVESVVLSQQPQFAAAV